MWGTNDGEGETMLFFAAVWKFIFPNHEERRLARLRDHIDWTQSTGSVRRRA